MTTIFKFIRVANAYYFKFVFFILLIKQQFPFPFNLFTVMHPLRSKLCTKRSVLMYPLNYKLTLRSHYASRMEILHGNEMREQREFRWH